MRQIQDTLKGLVVIGLVLWAFVFTFEVLATTQDSVRIILSK